MLRQRRFPFDTGVPWYQQACCHSEKFDPHRISVSRTLSPVGRTPSAGAIPSRMRLVFCLQRGSSRHPAFRHSGPARIAGIRSPDTLHLKESAFSSPMLINHPKITPLNTMSNLAAGSINPSFTGAALSTPKFQTTPIPLSGTPPSHSPTGKSPPSPKPRSYAAGPTSPLQRRPPNP
jgi:hypothetical protein